MICSECNCCNKNSVNVVVGLTEHDCMHNVRDAEDS